MDLYPCSSTRTIQGTYSVVPSSVLFALGILGNIFALVILWHHKQDGKNHIKTSVFYIQVTGLTIVNFMGKVIVCPIVLAAYSKNETLFQVTGDQTLCGFFAFCMTFFGLAPTIILLAMALDCWLALAHPFTYQKHVTNKVGLAIPIVSCIFSLTFCSLPFFGIGKFVQYCPGTWCFIEMTVKNSSPEDATYSLLYSTVMGLLVVAIILCNMTIMRHLYKMYRSKNLRTCTVVKANSRSMGEKFKEAKMEETDHLVLLAVMTVLFAICSLPLTGRVYMGIFSEGVNEYYDLLILRLLSMNSVVDPWIFIICRSSAFCRHIRSLCDKLHGNDCREQQLLPPTYARSALITCKGLK
ncbi:prostaglandin D2 receptor isoform X2 [Hyperolius riggenbachi]|uniref:prostaglandin D2 receptor isoform X2 n=1 Tax=Hyperolius riggenbachi TaxID=752182 RepID=UPI0035A3B3A1